MSCAIAAGIKMPTVSLLSFASCSTWSFQTFAFYLTHVVPEAVLKDERLCCGYGV